MRVAAVGVAVRAVLDVHEAIWDVAVYALARGERAQVHVGFIMESMSWRHSSACMSHTVLLVP